MLTLEPMPGRWGRVYYRSGSSNQRHGVGKLFDLGDADAALARVQQLLHQYPQATHLDVHQAHSLQSPVLQTILLRPALAGPAAPTLMPTVHAAPDMPPALDPMSMFLFQQQEGRLRDARALNETLQGQLRTTEADNVRLRNELAEVKIDLKLRDKTHELDKQLTLANATPAPSGLGALPPEAVQGLFGMAMQYLPKLLGIPTGPAEQMAGAPAELPAASDNHREILQGIAALLPTEKLAAEVYAVLSRVLPQPNGIEQLLHFAGLAQPQQPHPQHVA